MEKSVLRKHIAETRNQLSLLIDNLVKAVIEDSESYAEAVKNLKSTRWAFSEEYAEIIIEYAIKKVEKMAMEQPIKS